MQDLLTLKEIASRLEVPESNLRYYKNKIGSFLPSVGKGRRRRYLPEAVDIFARTIQLVQEGMTLDRVYTYLAQEQPLEVETKEAATAREAFADRVVEKLKVQLSGNPDGSMLEGENEALRRQLDELKLDLRQTREKVEALQREIERLRVEKEESETNLAKATEQLEKKEQIVEFQKNQLLEARDKRLNIQEELRQIRVLIESQIQKNSNIPN